MKYKSDYINVYFRKEIGKVYNSRINNKFELFIFELEKYFLTKIFSKLQNDNKIYLDFACGTGRAISFVADNFRFKRFVGVDISPYMVEQARRDNAGKKIDFFVADILNEQEAMKIPKSDIVTCFRLVLNLEPEYRAPILKALNGLMAKNSLLIINNHMNRYSFLGIIAYLAHKLLGMPLKGRNKTGRRSIINTLSYNEMEKMLEDCGFKILKVFRFCLLPGHKSFLFLPLSILFQVEKFLSKVPFVRKLSKDQIYLCKKVI